MWTRSENSDSTRPDAFEFSGNNVIVRKGFKLISATDDIPEHYEYDEWQMTKDQYDVYQYHQGLINEQADALIELAEMLSGVM